MDGLRYRFFAGVGAGMVVLFSLLATVQPAHAQLHVGGWSSIDATEAQVSPGLLAFDDIASVTWHDMAADTPSLDTLMNYDVLLLFGATGVNGTADSAAFGDVLADYLDQGGAVVFGMGMFTTHNIAGRVVSDGYIPFVPSANPDDNIQFLPCTLGDFDANHPIMQDVEAGTSCLLEIFNIPAANGGVVVASTTDSQDLVIAKPGMVSIQMYTFSTYVLSGNPFTLLHNSIVWAHDSVPFTSVSGTVTDASTSDPLANASVSFFDATGDTVFTSATTAEDGTYSLPSRLPAGRSFYAVVSKETYADYESPTIDITGETGQTLTEDFQLHPILEVDCQAVQTTLPLDSYVQVSGTVTQPTNTTSTTHTAFYIQDGTGYGVEVYQSAPWTETDLARGDSVQVVGQISDYNGITEITNLISVTSLGTGAVPSPLINSTSDLSALVAMEGSWARAYGALGSDPGTGGYTLSVDDGSGAVDVYINAAANLDLSAFAQGDWIGVDGVISLYQGAVEIVPSQQADIFAPTLIAPANLQATLDNATGAVDLTWEWSGAGSLDEFQTFTVYRDDVAIGTTADMTYTDNLPDLNSYSYHVVATYDEGDSDPSNAVTVDWTTGVKERQAGTLPTHFSIAAAYPNPFNASVQVVIGVPAATHVRVRVFNIAGRLVDTISQGLLAAGYHRFAWTANSPSGVYFIQATAANGQASLQKVTYLK